MPVFLTTIWLLLTGLTLRAQQAKLFYALIVGILDYTDSPFKYLKYGHRHAESFADYLPSRTGRNVHSENIKLLTNEDATISRIYDQKRWLEDKARDGGTAFIYFSDHGDVKLRSSHFLW